MKSSLLFKLCLKTAILCLGLALWGDTHADTPTVSYPINIYGVGMSDSLSPLASGCFTTASNLALQSSGLGAAEGADWACIQATFAGVGCPNCWSATGLGGWSLNPNSIWAWDATYTANVIGRDGSDETHTSTASVDTFCAFGGGPTTAGGLYFPAFCLLQPKPNHDNGCHGGECTSGNPITTASGNKFQSVTDFRGGGPFPLEITRAYNSSDASQDTEGMGYGWRDNFSEHLSILAAAAPLAICQEPSGQRLYYYCPPTDYLDYINDVEVTVINPDGSDDRFTYPSTTALDGTQLINEQTGTGQLYFVSSLPSPASGPGFRYVTNGGYTKYYTSTGQLVIKQNPAGLRQTYTYVSGQLTTITDPTGRTLSFAYTSDGHIHTITNYSGGVYTYTYSTAGIFDNDLIGVTYPDGSAVSYVYSNSSFPHALTGLIDENKVAENSTIQYATWGYDANGRATSSQHAGGVDLFTITYSTDTSGNQVTGAQVVEPNGLTRYETFTATSNFKTLFQGATQRCTECKDNTQSMTYDSNGFISSRTNFSTTDISSGLVTGATTYLNDSTGLELTRIEGCEEEGTTINCATPEARTISTQWDPNLRQPTLITEPGRTTAYTYYPAGQVHTKTVTDTATGVARLTTYAYNSAGLIETVTDPMNHVTSYGYDAQNNLTTITKDPSGLHQVTSITYSDSNGTDYNGYPRTITDPNDVVTLLGYDARQRLTSRIADYGGAHQAETDYQYDYAGELKKVTLATGSYLSYQYDDAHRLTDITDSASSVGDHIHFTLDASGNRHIEDTYDPSGIQRKTLTRIYNDLNQLINLVTTGTYNGVANTSETTIYAPDAMGNVTSITDPKGNITTQGFDTLNRLAAIADPQTPVSGNTSYNYDLLDRVQDVTDPMQLDTHYVYDAFGDVTQLHSPDTGTTAYTFDLDGNRLTKTDARGVTSTYTYDVLNRVTSISYPDASRDVTYTYDQGANGIGHLYSITDATGTTTYGYDSHGNVTQKAVTMGTHAFNLAYQYDLADNLKVMTYPSGMNVYYGRDAADRVTSVTSDTATFVSGIIYEPFGPVMTLTFGNQLAESRAYDMAYQLQSIDATGVQGLSFTYDADGNITGVGDSVAGTNQALGYDTVNRLTSASGPYGSQSYQYDLNGNRTQETLGGTTTPLNYLNASGVMASNQLLNLGYKYDAMGNTVDDGIHSYNYDAAGRLTGYGLTGQPSTATDYLYNGLGERSIKFPVDDAGPTVTITSPTGGISGTVTVAANVADDFGVSNVQFQLDGVNFGAAMTSPPYQATWNTSAASIGSHTLTATAIDPAGNTGSATVTVNVLDVTPPTVSMTAPISGADVSGTVTVSATASDNVGVAGVSFYLDGSQTPLTTLTAAPYTMNWNSTTITDGSHTLTAIASDAAGNATTSTAVVITVDNTPPSVSITAPGAGNVSGTVTVSASASDSGSGVASVQFLLDGQPLGPLMTTGSYTYPWNTIMAVGGHTLTAVAQDNAGNSATSAPISVTVQDVTPPTVAITSPTGGSVSGTIIITASASDNVGVTKVQFKLDGANLGAAVTSTPYTASWNTVSASDASHTLSAVAYDAAGNTATSATVSVTVPAEVPFTPTLSGSLLTGNVYLKLTWFAASTPITSYVLQSSSNASFTTTTQVYSGTETSDVIRAPNTGVYFRVHACNSAGCSAWSTTFSWDTGGNGQ